MFEKLLLAVTITFSLNLFLKLPAPSVSEGQPAIDAHLARTSVPTLLAHRSPEQR